jgi:UDP-glucuronate 4-epimerase
MIRDFTYVDDIVESITRLIPKPLTPRYNLTPSSSNHSGTASNAPAQVFNIGNSAPVQLMAYIEALEKALGKTAKKNYMDIQAGDVPATHADVSKLEEYVDFRPQTSVEEGVKRFVDWYLISRS